MLDNTNKEKCLNYPLQILKCVLPIVFETLKSFNQNFCEGRSSILIEKAFFEAETKKVNGNILPNDTILSSFPLSQYYLWGTWRQKSWAKTWRSKFCNVAQVWLWEDLLELQYQDNYTSLTHWVGTFKWSHPIHFSDSSFDLTEARTHQERRDLGTFPQQDKDRGISHGILFQPSETAQGKSGNWA